MYIVRVFFLFKQKTAYERRISDWSSDVCSSDLPCHHVAVHIDHRVARILLGVALALVALGGVAFLLQGADEPADPSLGPSADEATGAATTTTTTATTPTTPAPDDTAATTPTTAATDTSAPARVPLEGRSEEHTSELQSLMRISYAVFCLKQKTHYPT